jgi:alpha-amylase/alpha-mannosidase (GH57 family)
MHQPTYKDPQSGSYILPFVRLHGVKGYYDMVSLALEYPHMKMTINLVPSLLQQIDEYAHGSAKDFFIDLTLKDPDDLLPAEKIFILKNFFMNRWDTQVYPHPRYSELLEKRGGVVDVTNPEKLLSRFSRSDIMDLQALFNLSWFGFSAKRRLPEIGELFTKGRGFTAEDKKIIIDTHLMILSDLIPLYRKAFDGGAIELTTSPFYHPILPLVIDTESARRALPDIHLPARFSHPEDAREQVASGIAYFTEKMGKPPRGMWPPEGAVSPEVIPIFAEEGIGWIATDEGILQRSRIKNNEPKDPYLPYRAVSDDRTIAIVFRDQKLSDLISFAYGKNEPDVSVANFLQRVERIGKERRKQQTLITIALDGENPWEGYPDGGEGFLRGIFDVLSSEKKTGDVDIEPTTIGAYLDEHPPQREIQHLHSGSWINKNFGIWIGHPEDNRGWDCLKITREHLTKASASGAPAPAVRRATELLFAAEGSDWFWWFGDDFFSEQKESFDHLFRAHLSEVFRVLGDETPEMFLHPIRGERRIPETRPALGFITPSINGIIDDFFEWANASYYEVGYAVGAMYGGISVFKGIHFGFSEDEFSLRLDVTKPEVLDEGYTLSITLMNDIRIQVTFPLSRGERSYALFSFPEGSSSTKVGDFTRLGIEKTVELSIPVAELDGTAGQRVRFYLEVTKDGVMISRCPHRGTLETTIPDENFELQNWSA